jgi:hypothetical protein
MAELGGYPYGALSVRVSLLAPPVLGSIAAGCLPDFGPVLARSRLSIVIVAVPTVAVLALGFGLVAGGTPTVEGGGFVALLLVTVAAVAGFAVYVIAESRLGRRVRRQEPALVEWRASPDERYRRRVRIIVVGSGIALVIGGVILAFVSRLSAQFLPTFGTAIAIQGVFVGRSREFSASESGVVVGKAGGIGSVFVPWGRFEGWERTDDALVLRRRLPFSSFRCALADLDDPEEIERILRQTVGGESV